MNKLVIFFTNGKERVYERVKDFILVENYLYVRYFNSADSFIYSIIPLCDIKSFVLF